MDKNYYELKKYLHKCIACGKQDAYTLGGRIRCFECTERYNARHREKLENPIKKAEWNEYCRQRWKKKKAEGKCPICGEILQDNRYVTCKKCRYKNRRNRKRRKQEKEVAICEIQI